MLPIVRKKADQNILSVVLINYLTIREEWVEEIARNEMFSLWDDAEDRVVNGHFRVLYALVVGALRIFSKLWYHKVANGNMGLKVVLNSVQSTVQERNCVFKCMHIYI